MTAFLWFVGIAAVWNLVVFLLYGADKRKAQRGAWRIPERVLLGCSILFGGVGCVLGMICFRHKTKKPLFGAAGVLGILLLIGAGVLIAMFG